ncbi:MAG: metal-dependent hydrolase [Acidobacteria bacterium]|nr:metal-dependent hydrolase [Acidobacteriota bacterium]
MPLPVAHGLVGAAVVAALHPRPGRLRRLPLVAGALLANCADLDFALVFLLHSKDWHRSFTHSLFFALALTAAAAAVAGRSRLREVVAYGAAFASHCLLDYATTKAGGGLELLWPLSDARLGLRLWGLSEMPSRMPPGGVLKSLLLEAALFAPLLFAALYARKRAAQSGEARRKN